MPGIPIKGMSCEHCKKAVTDAIAEIPGIASASVDLQKARADWTDADPDSPVSPERVREAVRRIGFDAG